MSMTREQSLQMMGAFTLGDMVRQQVVAVRAFMHYLRLDGYDLVQFLDSVQGDTHICDVLDGEGLELYLDRVFGNVEAVV